MLDDELMQMMRRKSIQREAIREYPYADIFGKITIGIGHNLTDNPLPKFMIDQLFEMDVKEAYNNLVNNYPWFDALDKPRKTIILYMMFAIGLPRFSGFKKMIKCMEKNDFGGAAREVLNSNYNAQVPNVTKDIA